MSVTLVYLEKSAEGDAEKCPHGTDQQLIQMTVGKASVLITLPYDAVYDYCHMMLFMVRCIGIRAVVDQYSVAMAEIMISDI